MVKATAPPIKCGKCGKHGHTKRSCKVGLAASDDDEIVNDILMTVSPPVPIGAGGDHNEEEAMSGAEPDEDEEGGGDGEDDAANEEEEENDLDDIATFNDIFDVVMKQRHQVNSDFQSSESDDEGGDVE